MGKSKVKIDKRTKTILEKAFKLMCKAKAMSTLFEKNAKLTAKYVHATSRGHEAIQIACGMQLKPYDYAFPYYRDDAMILSMGMQPYDLMLQLLAKASDPFSGGRTYYAHPSLNDEDKPKIPHQSSATGMQAIPATGVALGFWYQEQAKLSSSKTKPICVCSLGDASVTEGEVSEAFQMAALKQLPILYVIQDNDWDISAYAPEFRAQNAFEYANGFHGLEARQVDGSDFLACHFAIEDAIKTIRKERRPILLHAKVPLLNHHTSGVRMEWYRDDLEEAKLKDPFPIIVQQMLDNGWSKSAINDIEEECIQIVQADFNRALEQTDPSAGSLYDHIFKPTSIIEESGNRTPSEHDEVVMVDCALLAIEELMHKHPECLLYGQDVGARLGGVFREAATLAAKFGEHRVFNTPIQEAFIIGSTVGMSAVGLKPIVEVQFADYIWPGLNQLFTEVSRSCYLSNGKWPVSMILRVPIGAYGSGGPYHSSSVESIVTNIIGLKVCYPSNGADLKGLMKAAYYDPNPVVMFEHKGLYWSKVKGTDMARSIEPDEAYILPLGKGNVVQSIESNPSKSTLTVITYGMGVHWALNASKTLQDQVEIIDLRTLVPLDEELIYSSVRKTKKCLVVTEEPSNNSFARGLSSKIQEACFEHLDGPVRTIGSENTPAIPLNSTLEQTMIPSTEKVKEAIEALLNY